MRNKARKIQERICALVIALALVLSNVLPQTVMTVEAAEGDLCEVTFEVKENGNALAGADVKIRALNAAVTSQTTDKTTDQNGMVTFEVEEGTKYGYFVSKDGYERVEDRVKDTFTASQTSEKIIVDMEKIVTEIGLEPSGNQTIKVGDTLQFKANTNAAKTSWESDNKEVATVDNTGKVTGKKAGSATIKVTYDNLVSEDVTKEVTVNVEKVATNIGLTLESKPADKVDAKVTAKVTNLPEDATGEVSFTKKDANGEETKKVKVTQGKASYTFDVEGEVSVLAKYSGDVKYSGSDFEQVVDGKFTKSQKIEFSEETTKENPKVVTLDQKGTAAFEITYKGSSVIKGELSYKAEKEEAGSVGEVKEEEFVVVAEENGAKVTAKKSGLYRITVTAAEKGNFNKAEAEFYVYVQDRIDFSSLTLSQDKPFSRVYDGTTDVKGLKVFLSATDLQNLNIYTGNLDTSKGLEFDIDGKVENADADSYTKLSNITVNSVNLAGKDIKNDITFDGVKDTTLEADITIEKRPVVIGTKNVEITNAQDRTTKNLVESLTEQAVDVSKDQADMGFLNAESDLVKGIKVTTDSEFYYESDNDTVNKNQVKPVFANLGKEYRNYTLSQAKTEKLGNIKITNMSLNIEDILANVELSEASGKLHVVKENGKTKVWVGEGNIELKTTVKRNIFYDEVCFTTKNAAENGTSVYERTYVESGNDSVYIYLKNHDKICSQLTGLARLDYFVDTDKATVEMGQEKLAPSALDKVVETITFGLYTNKDAEIPVTVKDLPEKNMSGINYCSYAVYEFSGENVEITAEEIKELYENAELNFTPVKNPENGFNIPIKGSEEGYKAALVYVKDNVGNTVIYSSNGIVVEVNEPIIKITETTGNEINKDIPYSSDLKYKVTVNDLYEKNTETGLETVVISGIEKYTVSVYDGKELQKEETKQIADKESLYKLDEIKKLTDEYTDTVSKESNNLKIKVEAWDQAGNKMNLEKSFMIDKTVPKIETYLESDASAQNDKYYNEQVTTVVKYTEKNFVPEKLTFDIYLENKTYEGCTLEELKALTYKDASGEKPLFTCSEIVDSQKDDDVTTYTNDRTNTLRITANSEDEYKIVPHIKDLGGLENQEKTEEIEQIFVYDATDPVLDITFDTVTPGINEDSRAYTQEDVTATVKVTEKNFWKPSDNEENPGEFGNKDPMNFNATSAKDLEGNKVLENTVYKEIAEATKNWSSNGIEYTNSAFTFTEDANYIFGFTYTDLAGNSVTYNPAYFTVDDTKPTGSVSLDKNVWKKFVEIITWGLFKNSAYDVSMTSGDVTAGVETTEYYYHKITAGEGKALSKDDLEKITDWTTYDKAFPVGPNNQFIVYEKVVDKAKNVEYFSSNGAIADNENPTIDVKILNKAINGIYNSDVEVQIDAKDPRKGDTYSGLEKIWYEVTATGNVTNKKTETLLDNSDNRVQSYETFSKTITIDAKAFNSNDVKLKVHAVDFTGNEYTNDVYYKNPLKIDVTKPIIENITWNTSAASNGKYYNVTRVATITVRERNFDPNQVRLNITNTDGTAAHVSGWKVDASGTSDNNINTCTVSFESDGDYNMNVSCTDKAEWASNTQTVEEFAIDKTVPVINVTFDNKNPKNGKYYNASRTATITVNEHNFNGSEVQTAITSNTAAPHVNGWSGGDVHSATIPFTADGEYAFTVNYTDLAGNPAQVVTVDQFVIDQTKPEIEIFDIEDKSANNAEVAPGVRYSDTNHDVKGVSITYSGAKHTEKAVDGARSSIPNGESIKMADFEHTQETDDVYTMVAKVTDLAGNSDEKTVTFSVNRFGSNFLFSDETKKFLDNYYNNEEEDLVITEINVDTLVHRGITCGREGDTTDFTEGTDYTVRESGTEASWKSYQYTLSKANFEEEGLYNVTIDSVDRATNQVNNKVKEADIEFVIDKTAPTVVITGIEDQGQYRENERDITITAEDNVAMNNVDVYVNDAQKSVESYDAEAIRQANGELSYTLESSSDWQEIKAVAVDMAGNVTDTSKSEGDESDAERWVSVLVTSNVFVQFYRNTPLVIGSAVGLAAVIAILIIFFKRRKKDEEMAE